LKMLAAADWRHRVANGVATYFHPHRQARGLRRPVRVVQ
jgi:hypothetical protein